MTACPVTGLSRDVITVRAGLWCSVAFPVLSLALGYPGPPGWLLSRVAKNDGEKKIESEQSVGKLGGGWLLPPAWCQLRQLLHYLCNKSGFVMAGGRRWGHWDSRLLSGRVISAPVPRGAAAGSRCGGCSAQGQAAVALKHRRSSLLQWNVGERGAEHPAHPASFLTRPQLPILQPQAPAVLAAQGEMLPPSAAAAATASRGAPTWGGLSPQPRCVVTVAAAAWSTLLWARLGLSKLRGPHQLYLLWGSPKIHPFAGSAASLESKSPYRPPVLWELLQPGEQSKSFCNMIYWHILQMATVLGPSAWPLPVCWVWHSGSKSQPSPLQACTGTVDLEMFHPSSIKQYNRYLAASRLVFPDSPPLCLVSRGSSSPHAELVYQHPLQPSGRCVGAHCTWFPSGFTSRELWRPERVPLRCGVWAEASWEREHFVFGPQRYRALL